MCKEGMEARVAETLQDGKGAALPKAQTMECEEFGGLITWVLTLLRTAA